MLLGVAWWWFACLLVGAGRFVGELFDGANVCSVVLQGVF